MKTTRFYFLSSEELHILCVGVGSGAWTSLEKFRGSLNERLWLELQEESHQRSDYEAYLRVKAQVDQERGE